jgi:hypothetical protein
MRSLYKVALLSQALRVGVGVTVVISAALSPAISPAQAAEKLPDAPTGEATLSPTQVAQLVESFRLVAQQSTSKKSTTLYSDWRVSKQNISPWTQQCLSKDATPEEFDRDATTASQVVTCVVGRVLNNEYKAADRDEVLAVRRTAAWWMTGDASRYNSPGTATYTQRILDTYQKNQPIAVVTQSAEKPETPSEQPLKPVTASTVKPGTVQGKPASAVTDKKATDKKEPAKNTGPSTDKVKPVAAGRSTPYDRYMKAGYDAEKAQNYKTALTFFRRALDERPGDTYATTAIQNTESKLIALPKPPAPKPSGSSTVVPTETK